MVEIPPAKDTDVEDVVWGLQTADTLWKRGERVDALVWLRRAAQAAGDANDDGRALELANKAVELDEWMTRLESGHVHGKEGRDEEVLEFSVMDLEPVEDGASARPPPPSAPPPPAPQEIIPRVPRPPAPSQPTLEMLEPELSARRAESAMPDEEGRGSVVPADRLHAGIFNPWAEASPPMAPVASLPLPAPAHEEEVVTSVRPQAVAQTPGTSGSEPPESSLPIATPAPVAPPPKPERASPNRPPPPPPAKPPPPPAAKPPPLPPRARAPKPPLPPAAARAASRAPGAPGTPAGERGAPESQRAIPEAPVRSGERGAPESQRTVPQVPARGERQDEQLAAEDVHRAAEEQPAAEERPPGAVEEALGDDAHPAAPAQDDALGEVTVPLPAKFTEEEPTLEHKLVPGRIPGAIATVPPSDSASVGSLPSGAPEPPRGDVAEPKLVLEGVEAFADLPDDARTAFAAAAKLHVLSEHEEIGTFALAYVVTGAFDVAATVVDAPAVRLSQGAVLRARGTTEEGVPMRLIGATEKGVVATWSTEAVEVAFRTIPWVEDDLRAAADRVQTLVGITIGPLGERLDVSIREEIVSRLTMRPLQPGEVVVAAGDPVPGLLLVGVGELELVKDDAVVGGVASGEFLFSTEVLGAGSAPATARAGEGGALVLFGDRGIAQELLVTCPPLLEVFAGM